MTDTAPLGLGWRSNEVFIMTTIGLGLFTDLFLYGLPVPLLPYIIERRLHLPAASVQSHSSSLLAVHTIAAVVFAPLAGFLTDKSSGRRLPYVVSVVALLLAWILFFLGESMVILLIARIIQGIAGAMVWTASQAILIDTVGSKNVGKATGSIYGTISLGVLAAPVLGGILYDRVGLKGPLLLGSLLLGVDLIMRLLMVEKKAAAGLRSRDVEEVVERPQRSEGPHEEDAEDTLLETSIDKAYIIPSEQHWLIASYPILYCFKDFRTWTAIWIVLIQATLLSSLDATVPTVGEEYYKFTSLQTGLLFIPILLPTLIIGPVAGRITDRRGPKLIVATGFGLLAPTLAMLRIVKPGGLVQVLKYCAILTICGTCLAATNPPALVEPLLIVEKYQAANPTLFGPDGSYAQVSSITGLVYNAGTAIGALLAGALKDAVGYGNMNLVTGALSLMTALLSLRV